MGMAGQDVVRIVPPPDRLNKDARSDPDAVSAVARWSDTIAPYPGSMSQLPPDMSLISHMKSGFDRLLDVLSPRRRELRRLRAKWGVPGAKDGFAVRRYFDLTRDSEISAIDDKTWDDLELPKVFASLDSTESPIGSQHLYRRLRTLDRSPEDLAKYHDCCQALRADTGLREEIQLQLSTLRDEANAQLADAIYGPPAALPRAIGLLPWWSLACLGTLAVVLAMDLSIWIWLATLGINALLIVKFTLPLHRELEVLRGCYRMLCVAEALAAQPANPTAPQELAALRAHGRQRAEALAELRLVSSLQGTVTAYLTVWLNLMFLAELTAGVRTLGRMDRIRAELASTFQLLGSLDAAVAVASYLEGHQAHCAPMLDEGGRLELVDGCHPLIARPVGNSIALYRRSALVTGSNMAGKTTFIKMVGLNVIFGRTLGFCLATRALIPVTGVMASIRSEHSVESGKSKYFAELEAVRNFIVKAGRGECGLFLIDELFNGTNTVERLAAGRAVLESLADQALVLATTHDVELQKDLDSRYDLYHFQANPDVEGYFDFRLRSGRSSQRNAIRLLEREGFPAEIVAGALAYSERYAQLDAGNGVFRNTDRTD
jgi:hypothetical protein